MDAQEEAGDTAKKTATMDQASNAGKHNCSGYRREIQGICDY